jgi:hypothetical protein
MVRPCRDGMHSKADVSNLQHRENGSLNIKAEQHLANLLTESIALPSPGGPRDAGDWLECDKLESAVAVQRVPTISPAIRREVLRFTSSNAV